MCGGGAGDHNALVALSSRTAQTLPSSWLVHAPESHTSQCKASHSFSNFRKMWKESGKSAVWRAPVPRHSPRVNYYASTNLWAGLPFGLSQWLLVCWNACLLCER